jgi:chemotaxis protein MotB
LGSVGGTRHRGGAILIAKGVSPQRLVAAGFGEFQPIDNGNTEEAFSRNRRIELKLTER